ncbi:class I SAM-dependent methyltransferase [Amycolatopsis sp. PS_44_ISF1]|uniref:class I SAM-dependent methyltransferase n=1 Tax=Amycolatopsis sp. PS_44_ISF1 TaxID=2974917 RepID=UPI0028DDD17C|nr:class I SAM-dependent methyltransferase [Amycolatopsis sp. PS_44_ISF1]MDT8913274.1 class I SAM-dependent methyltransferase [Amycolatopsis sp. PS_44_ISF1]
MPTLPEKAEPPSQAHRDRRTAESFGVDPARYDRARPRYPDELVRRIAGGGTGGTAFAVLDVGCGTGIGSRQFQAAGCAVLGVDPDARMAEFARGTGVEVEVATFEDWDPAGRVFDAVVAGQSWHWVEPVAGAAKAARLLRPGGRLAAFGHVFAAPPEVAAALAEVYRRLVPDSPMNAASSRTPLELYQEMFARAAEGFRDAGGFAEPEQWRFDWEAPCTRDEWLDHLPTTGGLTRLPPDQVAEVLHHVGAAIDALGGSFTRHYTTLAATAVRR